MKSIKGKLLIASVLLSVSSGVFAVKPFEVVCGDGEVIEVPDSKYSPSKVSQLCLSAGHPSPHNAAPHKRLSAASEIEKKKLILPAVSKARGSANGGSCGSDSSISRALDQCGKRGFISALCTKKGGVWSCLPSEDNSDPNVRPTGLKK